MSNFISQKFKFKYADCDIVRIFLTTTTFFIAPFLFLVQCCTTMIHPLENTAVSPSGVAVVICRVFYPAWPISAGPVLCLTLCLHCVVCCVLGTFHSKWRALDKWSQRFEWKHHNVLINLIYSGISIYRFWRGRRKQTMNADKRSIRKTITQCKYVVRSSSKVS